MKIKTFNQFLSDSLVEATIEPADKELDVTIEDVLLDSGNKIKSQEILGTIIASASEKDFLDYFYNEYGRNAFTETDTQTLAKFYNAYKEKENEKETEEEEQKNDEKGTENTTDEFEI